MKAIIDYHYITEINEEQTEIKFDGDWYEILTDQDGEFYFMYDSISKSNSIYFEVVADDFEGWSEEEINAVK